MVKSIQSLGRGLLVLEALADGPLSLADLAKHTALPKATLLRLLKTLTEHGWVHRRLNDGRYMSVERRTERTPAAPDVSVIGRLAGPTMSELTTATGLPCDLTLLIAPGVLEVIESTRVKRKGGVDPIVVGFRPSLVFSSPGRAVLSAQSIQDRQEHLDLILRTDSPAERIAVTSGSLQTELQETVKQGYAIRSQGYWPDSSDYGEEPMDIAVALFADRPFGSLSLVWPSTEADHADLAAQHLEQLMASAKSIAQLVEKYV